MSRALLFNKNGRRYQRHGRAYDPAINIWQAMIARCGSRTDPNYPNWGGRGIKVCDDWYDANTFCDWAHANGFQPGLTIERIDNDGDYEPDNCRWITRGEQGKNQRTTHRLTFRGRTMCLSDWARECGVTRQALLYRLKRGWSVQRTLTQSAR